MKLLLCALIGYGLGMINPSFLLAKIRGFDIRERGSGNAGASNALLLMGKVWGVLCAVLDIGKAVLAVWLTGVLFAGEPLAYPIAATACILGHIFPPYMRFRGGKGLACLGGIILGYDWRVFLVLLTLAIILAVVGRYICFVPMAFSVLFPVVYGVLTKSLWGALILLVVAPVIFWKHRENIKRIRAGREVRVSYLWNKKAETKRLRHEYPDDP